MEISTLQVILIFLASSIIGCGSVLDEFQTHRPLVACTVIGLILGDVTTGVMVGGVLEMIAIGWMNIGAAIAPDIALASVVSTILVIGAKQDITTAIALAIPVATAGQVLTIVVRSLTVAPQHMADKAAERGDIGAITRLHLAALLMQAMRIAIPSAIVAATVGTGTIQTWLAALPEVLITGLKVGGGMVAVVGYAMVINMMRAPHLMMFFYVGFVVAAFTQYNLIAFGVLGCAMGYFYTQLHPKYAKGMVVAQGQAQGSNKLDNRLD